MNYIKHLTGFFSKMNNETGINPSHISLYLTLFQCWNVNRFKNPTSISRDEIMKASKINSKATYHKCMKELVSLGFIEYLPSFNPYQGTYVNMIDLSVEIVPKRKNEQPVRPIPEQAISQANEHVIEQVYNSNNKTYTNNINLDISQNSKNEKIIPEETIPTLELATEYFLLQSNSETEAKKFYNYYSSNGWLVGGKTKMKDWKAAARNWMLNSKKFQKSSNAPQANHLQTQNIKNYGEPL
ncbi:MAG: transcriptional regulator [Flavobacterium sp.]